MKQVYASLMMLMLVHLAHAQIPYPIQYAKGEDARSVEKTPPEVVPKNASNRAVIYSEDFDGGTFPPSGWTVASGFTSTISNPSVQTWHELLGNPGMSAAIEFANGSDQHDEWLITPAIQLPNNPVRLKFDFLTSSYWHVDPHDNADFICTISTSGGTVADLVAGDSVFWEEADTILGTWDNFEWATFQTNISAYAGQTVHIGFHYKGQNAAQVNVDNVIVEDIPVHDLVMTNLFDGDRGFNFEHRIFSYEQVRPFTFTALLENQGVGNQTNVAVEFEIKNGVGTVVASGVSSVLNLVEPDQDTSIVVETMYTPPTMDQVYGIEFRLVSDFMDEVPENDTATSTLEVKDGLWARERGPADGSFQNVVGGGNFGIELGNMFSATGESQTGCVEVMIDRFSPVGEEVFAVIYRLEANGSFSTVVRSVDRVITDDDRGEFIRLPWEVGLVQINPGDRLLVTVGHYGGPQANQPIISTSGLATRGTVLGFNSFGAVFQFLDPPLPMIRINTDPSGHIDFIAENEPLNFTLEQNYPNPATGSSTINYHLQEQGQVTFEVFDIHGRLMDRKDQGFQVAGDYTIDLNLTQFATGVYAFSLTVDGRRATKQMVVK